MDMDNCLKILHDLITTDTTNPPGNESSLVQKILKIAHPSADEYQIVPVEEGRSNLILEIKGKSGRVIGFAGHLDTVPTGDISNWKYPPFAGKIANGCLYGRGASDMRGGLAAMLMLYLHFKGNGIVPPATLRFVFTADEESGGAGITALRNGGYLDDLSQLFVCEPTGCRPGIAEKGAVWIEVDVEGKSSHAAIPEEGVNALEYGMEFMKGLKTKIKALPSHPLLGACTCSVTCASAGIKTNTIPNHAKLSADIRIIPGISSDVVLRIAQDEVSHITSNSKVRITLNITNNREALEVPSDSLLLQNLRKVYEKLGIQYNPAGILFYTDASLVIPYLHMPFVILGPGEQAECHSTDEKLEISMVEKAYRIYLSYIETAH